MQYSYADRNGAKEKPPRYGVFVSAVVPGETLRTAKNRIQLNRIAFDVSWMKARPWEMGLPPSRMKP